jgi:hypothetical protein
MHTYRAEAERLRGKALAQQWQESKLLRAFTAALQSTATEAQLSDETKQQLKTVIDWSAKHADYVDPLTDLKWTLGQFKNPPWHLALTGKIVAPTPVSPHTPGLQEAL